MLFLQVTASSYTPSDSQVWCLLCNTSVILLMPQVLAAIPFIAEFKLACDGGEVRIFLIMVKYP